MTTKPQHLFVYGTLRSGMGHPMGQFMRTQAVLIGRGAMRGVLFDTGAYPAAVAMGKGTSEVRGEVYRLMRATLTLAAIDRYEGCAPGDPQPHLFVRRQVEVRLDDGRRVTAWVYIYNRDTRRLRPVFGGDWAAVRRRSARRTYI